MEKKREYRKRPGARLRVAPAVVGEALEALAAKHGGAFGPEDVVKAARPKSSPIHACFEWDDSLAAEAHRLWQARYLIHAVVVVEDGITVPSHVSVVINSDTEDEDARHRYMSTRSAVASPDTREQVIDNALRDLRAWTARNRHLSEFANVVAAAQEAELLIAASKARKAAKTEKKELQPCSAN